MPKSQSKGTSLSRAGTGSQAAESSTTALCCKADALYRAAAECCRQHERVARLLAKTSDDGEEKAAYATLDHCDGVLREMATAYEKAAARAHPEGDDAAWWHRANGLWHAAREFARRHGESDRAARRTATAHDPAALATLNMDYELEASALLALRHAVEAYRKVRPTAAC